MQFNSTRSLCLWIMSCLIAVTIHGNEISLASFEYPPYCGKDLEKQGLITQLIIEAFKREKYKIHLTFVPWARALEDGKSGVYDGIFTVWHREEREQWFVFSDPLPANEVTFLKRKGEPITYKTLQDLAPYHIGIIIGYAYPPEFMDAPFLKKQLVSEHEQNLTKLFLRRIDLVLIDKMVGNYTLLTRLPQHQNQFDWVDPPLDIIEQHLVFSKKNKNAKKQVEDFNRGLKQITADGTLTRIMKSLTF